MIEGYPQVYEDNDGKVFSVKGGNPEALLALSHMLPELVSKDPQLAEAIGPPLSSLAERHATQSRSLDRLQRAQQPESEVDIFIVANPEGHTVGFGEGQPGITLFGRLDEVTGEVEEFENQYKGTQDVYVSRAHVRDLEQHQRSFISGVRGVTWEAPSPRAANVLTTYEENPSRLSTALAGVHHEAGFRLYEFGRLAIARPNTEPDVMDKLCAWYTYDLGSTEAAPLTIPIVPEQPRRSTGRHGALGEIAVRVQ
ncbi:MAG TPA: hypothetical protein VK674_00935 [Candidatus Limnocylindria bacterium]|nr:hypothetical protein [Candidatus Limnocylindria bacterium]